MRVIILGADWCSYCQRAKAVSDAQGVPYTYHNLDMSVLPREASQLKHDAFLGRKQTMLPQIYLQHGDGEPEYLGGFTALLHQFELSNEAVI